MATSNVAVTPGTGKNLATHSISEDSITKEVSRININETDGSDVGLSAKLGIVTETAPATDIASSGLNGRLQRIAQRITSLIALLPTALGQGTMATSLKVVLPSDQSSLPVTPLNTTMSGKTSFATTVSMIARGTFTMTLASLATAGARQSTLLSNSSNYPAAMIFLQIESNGSAPTVGTVYEIYLLRSDGTTADDAAGASDAGITIENATSLGQIVVTATINKVFYGVFDTAPLGPLGATWGIAVKNSTGQSLNATEVNHVKGYQYYNPTQS